VRPTNFKLPRCPHEFLPASQERGNKFTSSYDVIRFLLCSKFTPQKFITHEGRPRRGGKNCQWRKYSPVIVSKPGRLFLTRNYKIRQSIKKIFWNMLFCLKLWLSSNAFFIHDIGVLLHAVDIVLTHIIYKCIFIPRMQLP